MDNLDNSSLIGIEELIESEGLSENDLFIVEDSQNTKKIKFKTLVRSLITDEESPASHRVYSSKKVDDLVSQLGDQIDESLRSISSDVSDVAAKAVTKEQLDSSVKKLDDEKANADTVKNIEASLSNYREKTETLTSKDLSTATDADKIHLANLGTDVIDAMTGKTQVSAGSVPTGGWVAENIANKSLSVAKFTKNYRFIGSYTTGSLDRLVEDGLYVVGSNLEKLPLYEGYEDKSRLLEVTRYGENGKYIIQRVYFIDQIENKNLPYYERKGLFEQLSILPFSAHFEISENNKVESDLLGNTYSNRGKITTGNLFDIEKDGNWYCTNTVANLPSNNDYIVKIDTYQTSRQYEATLVSTTKYEVYVCVEHQLSDGTTYRTEWFSKANLSKSKFDGKSVHIFGDGISYGMGASVINKTSYPALLSTKYGYRIYNHSLLDATAGNYSDAAFEDYSLLTQIKSASGLSNADYAIIFVGSEDFRTGVAPIGTDDSLTDTSFKGALNLAIKALLETNSNIKILLLTPIYRASTFPSDGIDSDINIVNDKQLSDFASAIIDIGKKHHIPVENLLDTCMINPYTKSKYLTANGVFLNDTGHQLIAEKVHDAMCKYY